MLRKIATAGFLATGMIIAAFAMAPDAVQVDPEHYSVEFENDRVRVLRIKYGPGEKSVMHSHKDSVAVLLTEGNFNMTLPDGTVINDKQAAGSASWADAGDHLPENLNDAPAEVVLIELK